MAKTTLVLYDLKNKTSTQKTHIVRQLFGYNDKSNNGQYTYYRKGLLAEICYKKWDKSVIVVEPKDEKKVMQILKRLGLSTIIIKLPRKPR